MIREAICLSFTLNYCNLKKTSESAPSDRDDIKSIWDLVSTMVTT